MCGIAGYFSRSGRARPMPLEPMAHRGPDDSGEWNSPDGRLWLGHTRLAILDLSPRGAQPMTDPATGNVIIFNGEIYNHREIRAALHHLGVSFAGDSDTETILLGYRTWKEQIIPKLKGMFAFALYDKAQGDLLLARDRLGIKPLYYHLNNGDLSFCSEARPLVKAHHLSVDPEGLSAYLLWGACSHRKPLYQGLWDFPAGTWMWASSAPGGQLPPVTRYWPAQIVPMEHVSYTARIRSLLENSVRQHLLSDVPIACLLSGGIDSSIITALAARHSPLPVNTFSVGFREASFDESRFARMMADRCGTRHTHIILEESEILQDVREAVDKMDLPSSDALNTYIVSKRVAKAGFKVALSGLGGDELFGGYPQFRLLRRFKFLALMPGFFREAIMLTGKAKHLLRDVPHHMDTAEFDLWWRRIWNSRMLREFNLPEPRMSKNPGPLLPDDFARISWSELRNYMRDTLLRDCDQMTMAHSLELRVPFLDHELVEYALGIPEKAKLDGEFPKMLLARSFADLMPREIYLRPKMGFELPMDSWMRGPLRPMVDEALHNLESHPLFHPPALRTLRQSFEARQLHWTKLWCLVVLGHKPSPS